MNSARVTFIVCILCLSLSAWFISCDCGDSEENESDGKTCTQACSFYIECADLEADYLNQCIIDCENENATGENALFACYVYHSTDCAKLLQCINGEDDDSNGDDDAVTQDVWTDSTTGLMWQNGQSNELVWEDAKDYCANLKWNDFDDWRMPTISELRSLIRGCPATESGGSCQVADDCQSQVNCWEEICFGCSCDDGPASGCYWPSQMDGNCEDIGALWSSTSVIDNNSVWFVAFSCATIDAVDVKQSHRMRCVR